MEKRTNTENTIYLYDNQFVKIKDLTYYFAVLHYMSDEEYDYYRRLVEAFGKKDSETFFDKFIVREEHTYFKGRKIYVETHQIPFVELGIEAMSDKYNHIVGRSQDGCLLLRSKGFSALYTLGKHLNAKEMQEWKESDDRNFLYELFIGKELTAKFRWDSIQEKIYRHIIKAIKTADEESLYECHLGEDIERRLKVYIAKSEFSDDEWNRFEDTDCKYPQYVLMFPNDQCEIMMQTDTDEKTVDFQEQHVYLKFGKEGVEVYVNYGLEVIERIAKYDKRTIYERQQRRNAYRKEKTVEECEKDERKITIISTFIVAVVGLVLYILHSHGVISDIKHTAITLLYGVTSMMACVGAFSVYSKWSADDPDTKKTAAGWICSLAFILIALTVIEKVFN